MVMKFIGWFCYYAGRFITWLLARVMWRIKIEGRSNIPAAGAFLLCPVHRSNIDGPLTCIFTRRRMAYLAKETMFKWGPTAKLYSAMGAFPINRGTVDRQSLNKCLEALANGKPLVLFPEGTRKEGPIVKEVNEGAAYLALRAGVPIVPVGIGGSHRAMPIGAHFLRFAPVRVVIGKPFMLASSSTRATSRSAIREGTELITTTLQGLYDEASLSSLVGKTGEKRVNS